EDTHSVTNSLRWGPDGWLYASQGSTVTGAMRRPGIDEQPFLHTMGQLIWRYHPETRRFEVFAEGGGNAFGCEIDSKGRVFSGHNGGNTRGFHYVQGAYLRKGFDKHGALSNPYAFGYFDAIKHHDAPRFSHNFLLYEGAALPEPFRGQLFGVEPLQGQIVWSDFQSRGATFQTRDISRPVTSDDSWFRPVDIKLGPDGAIYVADWYDSQVNHYRNHEGKYDPESGRVYRLQTRGAKPAGRFDLAARSTLELVDLLAHPNRWFRQTALRLLADRRDATVAAELRQRLAESDGQLALELLWALNLTAGLSETDTLAALAHGDPYVRLWAARLTGDERQATSAVALRLVELAQREPHAEVRSQLASTARRLPVGQALPIVAALASRSEDVNDPYIPLLIWWALEGHAEQGRGQIVALLGDPSFWNQPLVRQHLLDRLMRRYAQAGGRLDLIACAEMLEHAPDEAAANILLTGFEQAFAGRSLAALPEQLVAAMGKWGGGSLALRVRRGDEAAVREAVDIIFDKKAKPTERIKLIELFGQIRPPQSADLIADVAADATQPEVARAAISALGGYGDRDFELGAELVETAGKMPADLREAIYLQMAGRLVWARRLMDAVEHDEVKPADVPPAVLRRMLLHGDEQLATAVRQRWGSVSGETTAAIQREIARLTEVINSEHGSPYAGKQLFMANCGKCHTLFGDGGKVGPDLTAFRRDDLPNMLLAVANPSAQIREGYEQFLIVTDDGRALTGLIDDSDNQVILLRTADGRQLAIPLDEIEVMRPLGQSLMPEGALKDLDDRQIRDLFAYLRSTQPLNN
ncbi:MAG: c-type cytochrome, partial [Planctomycetales bacterium]|nr:c-type cytochrome [Planctomycetales bacterium]